MKNFKKVSVAFLLTFFAVTNTYAAYEEVTCSADAVYSANSCDQCFVGGSVSQGDNKGLLTDVWENVGATDQVLFTEEQEMPRIISLGGASWAEVKASDSVDFWTYTQDLDALRNEEVLGSVLKAGEEVTWIESTVGSAYQLESNPVPAGNNVGMILYDIVTRDLEANNLPSETPMQHRECVLFTSGSETETPVIPETPRLPETGAEHVILALAALLLGFGFLKFRRK